MTTYSQNNDRLNSEVEAVYSQAQPGLLFSPPHGIFLTIKLSSRSPEVKDRFGSLITELFKYSHSMDEKTSFTIGLNPLLWAEWHDGKLPPGAPPQRTILDRADYFTNSRGDLWFYLKSMNPDNNEKLKELVMERLDPFISSVEKVIGDKGPDGKILGHFFYDGITSPTDPAQVVSSVLMNEANEYQGACWGFSQNFEIKWEFLGQLGVDAKEDVIGRNREGVIIPDNDHRSHIQRARTFKQDRTNIKLVRQGLPYGHSKTGQGREKGLFFTSFSQSSDDVLKIIAHMAGSGHGAAPDNLLNNVQGISGGLWYMPNKTQLSLLEGLKKDDFEEGEHWRKRSQNGFMFYNSNDYLTQLGKGNYKPGDPPSQRILHLIGNIFSLWRDHWYQKRDIPKIPHLQNFLRGGAGNRNMQRPVAIRKGLAIKYTLREVLTNRAFPQTEKQHAWHADTFRIDPRDVLFGIMPELSLGRGKEVMPYLREDEQMQAFLIGISEAGAMGHIVPNHQVMLDRGLGALIKDMRRRQRATRKPVEKQFFESCRYALEGVQHWFENYALLARRTANALPEGKEAERQNLYDIAARANRLRTEAPSSFIEAMQMVFSLHCCLHLIGQPVPVGRLDQLVHPFYEKDLAAGNITPDEAQEIMDAFWVKLGEKALHNRHFVNDHLGYGDTATAYYGGNFPQGGGINQWVQQLTVGGYLPNDNPTPEPGANAITLMALKSSRRLPLNAPCLSLRMYPGMDPEIYEEAAKAILSGGAHPILFQEDKMVSALHEFTGFPLEAARDYACDGCYEPMIAGQTEFCFSNVAPLDAVELSINQGAKILSAGPVYLRGWKESFRSPHPKDIKSFEQLKEIFKTNIYWLTTLFCNNTLELYGNIWKVCPAPLLSVMIEGCVESATDLYNGGAKYHIIAPMFVGMASAIDSLYSIKKMVFDQETAVCSLPELVDCLKGDWGFNLVEPFQSALSGETRAEVKAKRYKELREVALNLPKFGTNHPEVDEIADWVSDVVCETAMEVMNNPPEPFKDVLENLRKTYSKKNKPWEMHMCPGIGTFEGYVGDGQNNGASPDGRRSMQPYPSDFSPVPVPQDLPEIPQEPDWPQPVPDTYRPIYKSMRSWRFKSITHKISNASPVDLNIKEDFPLDYLVQFIKDYANDAREIGSNLITITCVDPDTYDGAAREPEKYELIRVRMGGWTEYYAAMFEAHQKQHKRRPFFIPE
jgi:Dyp-type peroxidase family